jgi:uncharacterized protein YkwD
MSKHINFEELEKELFSLHNELRMNPQSYIQKLKECLKYFRHKIFHPPGEDPIQTYEGQEAVYDAIQFLKTQKPVDRLEFNDNIARACKDHANDIGEKGLATHEGSDDKNISDRIEKYCEWDGATAESLDFGFKTAENIIINLLIDDGVKDRYQRLNLFNEKFKYIGIGAANHRDYGICVVFGYVMNVRPLGSEPKNMSEFIQEYIKNTMNNKKKANNPFQEEEPDAPDNTISVKIVKNKKIVGGKLKKITKKIFFLDNGAQHIVEVEDI